MRACSIDGMGFRKLADQKQVRKIRRADGGYHRKGRVCIKCRSRIVDDDVGVEAFEPVATHGCINWNWELHCLSGYRERVRTRP